MSEYKIEKGIPLTKKKSKYPFTEMEVGDSFALPIEDYNRVSAAAGHAGPRNNMTFRVRRLENEIRVWRIK